MTLADTGWPAGVGPDQVDYLAAASPLDLVASGQGGLFASHDAGRSWRLVAGLGAIGPVAAVGSSLWALASPCGPSKSCDLALAISIDSGRDWAIRPIRPSIQRASLLRTGLQSAYMVSFAPFPKVQVLVTTDDGRTWRTKSTPCPSGTDLQAQLAHLGQDALWLLCGSQQTGGVQPKALYGSTDAGSNWALLASTPPFFGTQQPAVGNIPSGGYSEELVFVSPSVGYLALGRETLFGTTDGGRDWSEVISDRDVVGNGVDHVRFIDAFHGWASTAINEGALLYRTGDGGRTWMRTVVP